ncbi:MAG TPA: hypothetical protein VIJ00_18580 [Nakamurella sp.]
MRDIEVAPRRAERPDGEPQMHPAVADELLAKAEAQGVGLLALDGLQSQIAKAVLERALSEELTAHLG